MRCFDYVQHDISNTNCSSVKLKRCHAEPVEASFKLNMTQKITFFNSNIIKIKLQSGTCFNLVRLFIFLKNSCRFGSFNGNSIPDSSDPVSFPKPDHFDIILG